MSGGSALRILGSTGDDLDRALLDEWVIWQRARNVSDKTITERVLVVRRLNSAATISAVDVDRFLSNPVWSKATRATYHGAIRAWCLWSGVVPVVSADQAAGGRSDADRHTAPRSQAPTATACG